ncbi:uncharacterized protein LOC119668284 [Teleopsis dalmanni]|uniref:uncharacterized protein LOC119668284 n=1 Tax=Teleopsis dalmanni TaxID=139649 RepID=UPI0018CCE2AF|nr:uncharacterized protein LOC119668284 [Teleopsis dalmanni]
MAIIINKNRIIINIILVSVLLVLLTSTVDSSIASQDILPHPCDNIKCPPLSEITCPEDSFVRENLDMNNNDILPPSGSTEEPHNITDVEDELYAQCCLSKKCLCKTCYIPDCHSVEEVVIELIPESMETPGHCCGHYECHKEPNCTEVTKTENYWLTDCQRCKCYHGERICHQSCDEGIKKPTAICNSKNLNTFFEHGDSWKDGCYECECVHGEEKCVMPFCRSVNCPTYRQVLIKDSCCPICWPKGIPMPNGDEDYEEDDTEPDTEGESGSNVYHESDETLPQPTESNAGNEFDTLPNIIFDNEEPENISKNSTANGTSFGAGNVATPPCARQNEAATIQIYPEIVEVVHQTHENAYLYAIIGFLTLLAVFLGIWNFNLRAKQRCYRPVSHFDDNFNKTSSNIKKINV